MESNICGVFGKDDEYGEMFRISWEEAPEKYGLKQGEYTEY
jgi:hypothetical protein